MLVFRRLTPHLMDAMGEVLRGSWGVGCWCIYPRLTGAEAKEMRGPGSNQRRCDAMTKLARRRRAGFRIIRKQEKLRVTMRKRT